MSLIVELFLTFFKLGAITFGGGYAMLALLQREVCDRKGWCTPEELMDYYAIAQCTPGIIAVNVATFVGNKIKGKAGGVIATVAVVLPSIIIITLIAAFIRGFAELAVVKNAFVGIRAAVCVLILTAVVKLWKNAVTDRPGLVIFLVVFGLSTFTSLSPILLVVAAGATGILLQNRKAVK